MQQKYWDNGRSLTGLRITRSKPRAQLLRLRRKAKKGVGLAGGEQLHRLAVGRHDPLDVPLGVETDVGCHNREAQMAARLQRLDAHATPFRSLTLQIGSRANSS